MKISADEVLNCGCKTAPDNKCAGNQEMQNGNDWDSLGRTELLRRIDEIGFAAYDLQLFLDTHRDCGEALELYKSLAFTYRAAVKAYEAKYGPLSAMNSSDKTPFEWVSDNLKWPWQKEGEM